ECKLGQSGETRSLDPVPRKRKRMAGEVGFDRHPLTNPNSSAERRPILLHCTMSTTNVPRMPPSVARRNRRQQARSPPTLSPLTARSVASLKDCCRLPWSIAKWRASIAAIRAQQNRNEGYRELRHLSRQTGRLLCNGL